MLVHNHGAADAVHTIRFDGALSENFKKEAGGLRGCR